MNVTAMNLKAYTNEDIIVIGKDTVSFMQGIYTYIPGTNHVPKEYNVAAILSLLFMATISLASAFALMYFCSIYNYYYYYYYWPDRRPIYLALFQGKFLNDIHVCVMCTCSLL
jgi:hypothetical protein